MHQHRLWPQRLVNLSCSRPCSTVRPCIYFCSIFWSNSIILYLHCMYIGHDHSSPGTGSQGYRSRLAYRLGQCKNMCARLHDNIWPTCVAYWKRGIFSQAFLATPKMPLRRHQLSPSAARLERGRDQRRRRSSAHVVVVTRSVWLRSLTEALFLVAL